MAKLFAVVVATVPHYYEYKQQHPEHDRHQLQWFKEQCEVPHPTPPSGGASYPQELTLLIHCISTAWLGVDFRSSNGIFESEN